MSTNTVDPHLPQTAEPPRRNKTLTIVLAAFGALILLGLILGTAVSALNTLSRTDTVLHADASGISSLEVEANAGEFTLQFADVPEAQLDLRSERKGWDLQRRGDTLIVDAPDGWMQWCVFGCDSNPSLIVLTLPEALNDGQLNVELDLAAGEFRAEGQFNTLDIEMSAGRLVAAGAANSVRVQLGAGYAALDLADVANAQFEISAGRLDGILTGTAPESVQGEVNAGMLDLTLPQATYNLNSLDSSGMVNNLLRTDPESTHLVSMEVSAGNVMLRQGS